MIKDFWYGNTFEEIEAVDYSFYPNEGEYRGNFYINDRPVGDFTCRDSLELEALCPGIFED